MKNDCAFNEVCDTMQQHQQPVHSGLHYQLYEHLLWVAPFAEWQKVHHTKSHRRRLNAENKQSVEIVICAGGVI